MQGVHSIGGGGFFDGGGGSIGGGDRRLRPQQHQTQSHQHLKCPRCDSLNTKFCYYNNYNLSQPRYFCKSCRRYWTKGGVLRNVPVGGGCRKSKRSRAKNSSSENRTISPPPATSTSVETPPAPTSSKKRPKSNSNSSSESSSLTAANTASAATEAISAPTPGTATSNMVSMQDSKLFMNNQSGVGKFETGLLEQGSESGIFSEIGNLTGWITSTTEAMPFGFGSLSDTPPFRFYPQSCNEHLDLEQGSSQQQLKLIHSFGDHLSVAEITGGSAMLDQPVQYDLSSSLHGKISNTSTDFGSLDWHGVGDQGFFDLPNTADDQTYWSQNHWTEQDDNNTSHCLP